MSAAGGPPPPPMQVLQLLMGRFVSQSLGVVAKLSVADHLASGPKSADELAKLCGAHGPSLFRVLRMLAMHGVFEETDQPGVFRNTASSNFLRADQPGSVRPMVLWMNLDMHVQGWLGLGHSVQTGKPGFDSRFGEDIWSYFKKHSDEAAVFDNAMTGHSVASGMAAVQCYDGFAKAKLVIDVGGGHGGLLSAILKANPAPKGIVFDQPYVVAGAPALLAAAGVADRCQAVGGDFFQSVPEGGDLYVMKHILHDWSDEQCKQILDNIHRAALPGAHLVVVDLIVPPGNGPFFGKVIDLEMLVMTQGGKERTESEFRTLLAASGFEMLRTFDVGVGNVIESRRI